MRLLTLVGVMMICASAVADAGKAPVPVRAKLSPEMRAQRRAERARRLYETNGGIVQRERRGKVMRIVRATDRVAADGIDAGLGALRSCLGFPVEVVSRPPEDDPKRYLEDAVGMAVVLADKSDTPALLVAPEEKWAMVNVGKLAADGADAEKILGRTLKEIWRASAFAFGAGYADGQPDLMGPICSLGELDQRASAPSPACYNMMIGVARHYGIEPVQVATYRQACQEGWAPSPTNDVQRKIWKEVHEIPKTPMRIDFDPKKGR